MVKKNTKGFTLIELLIATTVFSIILLAAAATLIQIGRMYYKGVISSRTQGVARNIADTIGRDIQFSSGSYYPVKKVSTSGPDQYSFCFGDKRFTFSTLKQLSESTGPTKIKHVLWQDNASGGDCYGETSSKPDLTQDQPSANGTELLEENMRLKSLTIDKSDSGEDKYNIDVTVIYGDDDLLYPDSNDPQKCKGSEVGGQWCAFSELSTQVFRRVK